MTFNNEEACISALAESRWGNDGRLDVVCPYCGAHHCVARRDHRFRCHCCGRNFSCRVGTIFENSNLPLVKWLMAMYLISSHRKGVSSCQLARDIAVTQKTAWYVLHKIRSLYRQDDSVPLRGRVELDEVYVGGREKWKHRSKRMSHTRGRSTVAKTPVFGLMERPPVSTSGEDGEHVSHVRAFVVGSTDCSTLLPLVQRSVGRGSTVYSDEYASYRGLASAGYAHSVCNHSLSQYVDGDAHTNNIEGFWSHFRRMLGGCYHNVSREHLQSYVDEACYRWNTRKMNGSERVRPMFGKAVGLVMPDRKFRLCKRDA